MALHRLLETLTAHGTGHLAGEQHGDDIYGR